MASDASDAPLNPIELAAQIAIAWLNNPNVHVKPEDMPIFPKAMHGASNEMGRGEPVAPAPITEHVPAVPVHSSVKPDYIVSLIDGRRLKTLKRHLAKHGLTPQSYCEPFNLRADYPMVAASYANQRSQVAMRAGLGRKPATTLPASAEPGSIAPPAMTAPAKAMPGAAPAKSVTPRAKSPATPAVTTPPKARKTRATHADAAPALAPANVKTATSASFVPARQSIPKAARPAPLARAPEQKAAPKAKAAAQPTVAPKTEKAVKATKVATAAKSASHNVAKPAVTAPISMAPTDATAPKSARAAATKRAVKAVATTPATNAGTHAKPATRPAAKPETGTKPARAPALTAPGETISAPAKSPRGKGKLSRRLPTGEGAEGPATTLQRLPQKPRKPAVAKPVTSRSWPPRSRP